MASFCLTHRLQDYFDLTPLCLIEFPVLINWTNPFRIKGFTNSSNVLKVNSAGHRQTVQNLINRRRGLVLHCLSMSRKMDNRLSSGDLGEIVRMLNFRSTQYIFTTVYIFGGGGERSDLLGNYPELLTMFFVFSEVLFKLK